MMLLLKRRNEGDILPTYIDIPGPLSFRMNNS